MNYIFSKNYDSPPIERSRNQGLKNQRQSELSRIFNGSVMIQQTFEQGWVTYLKK